MIRPFEEPMAIEQAPPQHDGRVARGRRRDIQTFLWLCGWGGATALALIVFAVASQTKTATERLRQIFALNEPSAVAELPPRIAQLEVQTQFLTEQLRALATDRDRLTGRIALLESSLDDMTGVIKKQKAATDVLTAKTAALTANAPAAPPALPANRFVPSAPNPPPAATSAGAGQTDLPTGSIDPVPLPPTRAATPANESEPSAPAPIEFGLDLGGAPTVDGVRQRWTTVKATFGPVLSGMYPLAARDHRAGSTGYRLVVGPLPNTAAATGLCAHFTAARTACRSVKFDGEQIVQR